MKNLSKTIIGLSFFCLSFSLIADGGDGKKIYDQKCASCHHLDRIGFSGPPLVPMTLEKLNDEKLHKIIKNGLPSTLMVAQADLSDDDIKEVIKYLRKEVKISWGKKEIAKSTVSHPQLNREKIQLDESTNLTTVVERGQSKIWLMENKKILDKFEFSDVHGGIKYSRDITRFFIPSRAGNIGLYSLEKGLEKTVRACVSLRNITTSNDDRYLVASCLLPQMLVVLDQKTMKVVKTLPINGKVSGIYTLINENKALFTFRDRNVLGFFDFKNLSIKYDQLDFPIEDFFIDPLDRFLVGSSKNGEKFLVFDLEKKQIVFEENINGMPHLSSAAYWYDKGQFYFATFHIKSNFISVWQMYDWKLIKKIEVGGNGFFVKTHPKVNHLWIDKGDDELVLVNKSNFEIQKIKPMPGKKFTHTEFSKDGRYAYLSIFDQAGSLLIYDTVLLKEEERFVNSFPVGKYNVYNKEREYLAASLGQSVFTQKCWGCHHETSMAFGPSFVKIANSRSSEMVRTHLDNPKINALNLGYKNPTMPNIELSQIEKDMVTAYVMSHKRKLKKIKMFNMAEHELKHPSRNVDNCSDYVVWNKLGFSSFSEEDKKEEMFFKEICN